MAGQPGPVLLEQGQAAQGLQLRLHAGLAGGIHRVIGVAGPLRQPQGEGQGGALEVALRGAQDLVSQLAGQRLARASRACSGPRADLQGVEQADGVRADAKKVQLVERLFRP